METLESIISNKIDKIPGWRTFILFGALKRYRYYFWTYEERRKINEEYHKDLLKCNGFPVPYISIFLSKEEKPFINSFFEDTYKDYQNIKFIIWDIKHNLDHLNNIISICLEYEEGTSKYISASAFFEKVNKYIEEQKRNNSIKEPINLDADWREIHYIDIKEPDPVSEEELRRLENESKVEWYEKSFDEDFNIEVDYRIVILGREVRFDKENDYKLSSEEKKLLKNQFTKTDEATIDNCINLINNYKLFVAEKKYKAFKKVIYKNTPWFNSIYEDLALEIILSILRKFYSPAVYLLSKDTLKEEDEKNIREQLIMDLDEHFDTPEKLCWLIDLLSYCYKKGYYYLSRWDYKTINYIMRQSINKSPICWHCFDPIWKGQWFNAETGTIKEMKNTNFNFVKVISGILIESFYWNLNSSLIVDVFKIAINDTNFEEATKKIDKAISKYKKDIKEGRRTF